MPAAPIRPDRPVVIRRKKIVKHGGHHGGAWKIAYADFVTAMMAFFLLMWLLLAASDTQRRGISDYFENPLRVSLKGGDAVGEHTRPTPGGGEDLRRQDGERRRGQQAAKVDAQSREAREPGADLAEREVEQLERLKRRIEAAIEAIPSLQTFKGQLLLDLTSEGLRIQVVDQENRPMFDAGSARLRPHAQLLLGELARLLEETDQRISVSGHTDAVPFAAGEGGYSNWELSNDRANAARRALVAAGLAPDKTMRVVGLASTVLLDKERPTSPINRRISIVVMNSDTEAALSRSEGEPVDAPAAPQTDPP